MCYLAFMRKFLLTLVFLGLGCAQAAHAARTFPPDAVAGQVRDYAYPTVQLDDRAYRLAPGALIYDGYNRIIAPNHLPQGAKVLYRIDGQGQVSKMWLLTPEEAAAISQSGN